MKKQAKKLTLAKETLRSLEELGDLKDLKNVANVAGGTFRNSVCDGCDSGFNTCATFVRTCSATYLC